MKQSSIRRREATNDGGVGKSLVLIFCAGLVAVSGLTGCTWGKARKAKAREYSAIVSVKDQRLALLRRGKRVHTYRISTSKFGLGSEPRSYRTPLGRHAVARKIGARAPKGAVFKSRRRTGEVLKPNAPGRDPIVTRIIWLKGLEEQNRNSHDRLIYIHGTPEERTLGKPASYGCVRMRSKDIVQLFKKLPVGAAVRIVRGGLRAELKDAPEEPAAIPRAIPVNRPRDPAVSHEASVPGRRRMD